MDGPYASAALTLLAAGWAGVLPLASGRKGPPPDGFTGATGRDPSGADVWTWLDGPEADGNVALRLPADVIGLDVDAYDGREGAETLARGEQVWGALPATWRSTSRSDATSGVRLFRVPRGTRLLGTFGPGAEVVQHHHRYVVVAPSVHPRGAVYRWAGPDGESGPPRPEQLPSLPAAWLTALTAPSTRRPSRPGSARPRRPRGQARPAETAPAVATVETLAARTRPVTADWVSAALDDHLRQLARPVTRDVALDHIAAAGYLAGQAVALEVLAADDVLQRLATVVAWTPTDGPVALRTEGEHQYARALAAPWTLVTA